MERSERARLHGLMVQLANGDRASFHPLFETLWPIVRSFTGRMLSSQTDAEDAAQETLLKVFKRARDFDCTRDALTWTLAIATYEVLTLRRRTSRRRDGATLPNNPSDSHPTAEEALISREMESAAFRAFGELRAEDRAAIAEAFETRRGERAALGAAMRKRLQRALGRLRTAWGAKHGID